MKITILETKKDNEIVFPCLMIGETGSIVLMIGEGKDSDSYSGVLIKYMNEDISYNKSWRKNYFKKFTGSITLEND